MENQYGLVLKKPKVKNLTKRLELKHSVSNRGRNLLNLKKQQKCPKISLSLQDSNERSQLSSISKLPSIEKNTSNRFKIKKTMSQSRLMKFNSSDNNNFTEKQVYQIVNLIQNLSQKNNKQEQPNRKKILQSSAFQSKRIGAKPLQIPSNLEKYIDLLEKNLVFADQFIYLQYRNEANYYDLQPTDFQRIGNNYFTLSRLGLTYYQKVRPKQFIPLDKWLHDRKAYYKIRVLKFFEKFKQWKLLKRWRKIILNEYLQNSTRLLRQNLFLLNQEYRRNILFIKEVMLPLENYKLIKLMESTYDAKAFEERQFQNQNQILHKIQNSSSAIHNSVNQLFVNKLVTIKQSHKSNKKNGNIEPRSKKSKAYRYFNFVYEHMSYEQKLEVKEQCYRIIRYTYLVDFLVINSLDNLIKLSLNYLLAKVNKVQTFIPYIQIRNNEKLPPLQTFPQFFYQLVILITTNSIDMRYLRQFFIETPSGKIFIQNEDLCDFFNNYLNSQKSRNDSEIHKPDNFSILIEQLINQGITALNHFQRFSKHPQMIPYISILEEWDDKITQNWGEAGCLKPQQFVDYQSLKQKLQSLNKTLQLSLDSLWIKVQEFCKPLLIFHQLNYSMLSIQQNKYVNKLNLIEICEVITLILDFIDWQFQYYEQRLPYYFICGLWKINGIEMSKQIKKILTSVQQKLLDFGLPMLKRYQREYINFFQKYSDEMREGCDITYENFPQKMMTVKFVRQQFPRQKDCVHSIIQMYDKLQTRGIKQLRIYSSTLISKMLAFQNNMNKTIASLNRNYDQFRKYLQKILIPQLNSKLVGMSVQFEKKLFADETELQDYRIRINEFRKQIEIYTEISKGFTTQFQLKFQEFQVLTQKFKIVQNLKTLVKQYNEIQVKKYIIIKSVNLEELRNESLNLLDKLNYGVSKFPNNQQLRDMKYQIENLIRIIPLTLKIFYKKKQNIEMLNILKSLEQNLQKIAQTTLNILLSINLHQFEHQINTIYEKLIHYQSSYQILRKCKQSWHELRVEISYKKLLIMQEPIISNGQSLQKSVDQIYASLHIILNNSQFIEFKQQANHLYNQINLSMEKFRLWVSVQQNALEFYTFFNHIESEHQLPKQRIIFQNIFNILRSHNRSVLRTKYFYRSLGSIQMWKKCEQNFNTIYHSFQNYLLQKRINFPRFFFLSDEQLISAIVEPTIKNFENICSKCFDSVQSFILKDGLLVKIKSEIFELQLIKPINSKQSVYQIFEHLEVSIRQSLKRLVIRSFINDEDDDEIPQITLLKNQVLFTLCTEQAIENFNLEDQYSKIVQKLLFLSSIRSKLRHPELMIIHYLHKRDILQNLLKLNIQSINSFDWLKIIRYYFVDQIIFLKQMQNTFDYGYEWSGRITRLVVTPLTQKCWFTIFTSIRIALGTCASGPAGTGKTETIKQLTKSLGYLSITYNGTELMDKKLIVRFFSGFVQMNCWLLIDEFNRINMQVLSTISQLLITIRISRLKKESQFELEGQLLKLNLNSNIMTTMNPDYLNRVQLPQNIKSLFRPISMVIPDMTTVAQSLLFCAGFKKATQISKKLVQLYILLQKNMSNQIHYEFGLRAIKLTIKLTKIKQNEIYSIIQAIESYILPRLIERDKLIFNELVQGIFGKIIISKGRRQQEQKQSLRLFFSKKELQRLFQKAFQIYQTIQNKTGTIIFGKSLSGKSLIINLLIEKFEIEFYKLNPKVLEKGMLGYFNHQVQWQDGLFTHILKNLLLNKSQKYRWIIFDTYIQSFWVQDLNSVLDDNNLLCLVNGQRIKLDETIKLLFQVDNLSWISPATISRCGIIYLQNEGGITWKNYFERWLKQISQKFEQSTRQQILDYTQKFFNKYFSLILKYLKQKNKLLNEVETIISVTNIAQSLLNNNLINTRHIYLYYTFIYSIVWGSCNNFHSEEQLIKISEYCSNLFQDLQIQANTLIHHYYIDLETVSWKSFKQDSNTIKKLKNGFIFVETPQSLSIQHFLNVSFQTNRKILLTGYSATGKSSYIHNKVQQPIYLYELITVSTIQSLFQRKFIKKNRLISLPQNEIIAIEDIHLADKQKSNVSPLIEFLRCYLENYVWNSKNLSLFKVQDFRLICTCNPLDHNIWDRFTRHFNKINLHQFTRKQLLSIGTNILNNYLVQNNIDLKVYSNHLISNTIQIIDQVKKLDSNKKLLNFTYDIRDLIRMIKGLIMFDKKQEYFNLWLYHLNAELSDKIGQVSKNQYKKLVDNYCKAFKIKNNNILYTNLRNPLKSVYQKVEDLQELILLIKVKLEEEFKKIIINIQVIIKIIKISRLMILPQFNNFIIGNSGIGKLSIFKLCSALCKLNFIDFKRQLSSHLNSFSCFKSLLIKALQDKKSTVLYFKLDQIDNNTIKMVNILIKNYDIPNLFKWQEIEALTLTRNQEKKQSLQQKLSKKINIVTSVYPFSKVLKKINTQFRSLLQLSTFYKFDEWSYESLLQISEQNLKDDFSNFPILPELFSKAYSKMQIFGNNKNNQLYAITWLLDTTKQFKELYKSKKLEIINKIQKYRLALDKIMFFKQNLAKLDEFNKKNEIDLSEKQKQTRSNIEALQQTANTFNIESKQLEIQKSQIELKKAKFQQITENYSKQYGFVKPLLEKAKKSLEVIDRKQLQIVRAYINPPQIVIFILQGACILLGQKTDWTDIKQILLKVDVFLNDLLSLKINQIPEQRLKKLRQLLDRQQFDPKIVKQRAPTVLQICQWCRAVSEYVRVDKQYGGIYLKAKMYQKELKQTVSNLREKQNLQKQSKQKLNKLRCNIQVLFAQKNQIQTKIKQSKNKRERIIRFINLVDSQSIKWKTYLQVLSHQQINLIGDIFLVAHQIIYASSFQQETRRQLIDQWKQMLYQNKFQYSLHYSNKIIVSSSKIKEWIMKNLPNDNFCISNAIYNEFSYKYSYLVDPERIGVKWIKSMYKQINYIKLNDKKLVDKVKMCLKVGKQILIENVDELPSRIIEIIQLGKKSYDQFTKYDNQVFKFNPNFKLFLISSQNAPSIQINLNCQSINFAINHDYLKQKILDKITRQYSQEIIEEKLQNHYILQNNLELQQKYEQQILNQVFRIKSQTIIEDNSQINILSNSKEKLKKISEDIQNYEEIKQKLRNTTYLYEEMTQQLIEIFKLLQRFKNLNKCYQFSFNQFSDILNDRLKTYKLDQIVKLILKKYIQNMFKKDKIIFLFLFLVETYIRTTKLNHQMAHFLLNNNQIKSINKKQQFQEIIKNISISLYNNYNKIKSGAINLQDVKDLNQFQILILTKLINPLKLKEEIRKYCLNQLKMDSSILENNVQELIINSSGINLLIYQKLTDPSQIIFQLSHKLNINLQVIELSKNYEKIIKNLTFRASLSPNTLQKWILIENIQLSQNRQFGYKIENLLLNSKTKLFMSMLNGQTLPVSLLKKSLKIPIEPVTNIRSKLEQTQNLFEKYPETDKFFKFKMIVFHTIVRSRERYKGIGWNLSYEFNKNDLTSFIDYKLLLSDQQQINQSTIVSLLYGSRIANEWDLRILQCFFNQICQKSQQKIQQLYKHLKECKENSLESLFLYDQTSISIQTSEMQSLNQSLLLLQYKSISVLNKKDQNQETIKQIYQKIPTIDKKSLIDNNFYQQQVQKYSLLISVIKTSLYKILNKISEDDQIFSMILQQIYLQKVPTLWKKYSFKSEKSLSSWILNLIQRIQFINYCRTEKQVCYWLPGFFYPQGFINYFLQKKSVDLKINLHEISLQAQFTNFNVDKIKMIKYNSNQVYVYGLYFEGCEWDIKKKGIISLNPSSNLLNLAPILKFTAVIKNEDYDHSKYYECPIYRCKQTIFEVSTTGQSTNYIMSCLVPYLQKNQNFWILRNVLLLCETRD